MKAVRPKITRSHTTRTKKPERTTVRMKEAPTGRRDMTAERDPDEGHEEQPAELHEGTRLRREDYPCATRKVNEI
jgi:hypothetical protein